MNGICFGIFYNNFLYLNFFTTIEVIAVRRIVPREGKYSEDINNPIYLQSLLDNDEISPEEEAFIRGYFGED
jgi:hypothetical protein